MNMLNIRTTNLIKNVLRNEKHRTILISPNLIPEDLQRENVLYEENFPGNKNTPFPLCCSQKYYYYYWRPIGDLLETHRRPTCLIGDQHASSETGIPDQRPVRD